MNVNMHFESFESLSSGDKNFKIVEFIDFFKIKNVESLKNLKNWNQIEDSEIKKKIYNKVYYFERKKGSSCEAVKVFSESSEDTAELSATPLLGLSFIYLISVFFSLIFLMNESKLFYLSYGFSQFNSYLLPVLVEVSILLLSLDRGFKSKTLMIVLISYNLFSFSFFTLSEYDEKATVLNSNRERSIILNQEKVVLLRDYSLLKAELEKYKILFDKASQKKFITRANNVYLPRIESVETKMEKISSLLSKKNELISNLKASSSREVLLVGTVALIILKLILQLTSILFLRKIDFSKFRKYS